MTNIATHNAIYTAEPSFYGLKNLYSIYPDKIQLKCKYLYRNTVFDIFKDDIVSIAVYKPPVFKTDLYAFKLDLADFKRHVGIETKGGILKKVRFTPKDAQEFVKVAKEAFDIK